MTEQLLKACNKNGQNQDKSRKQSRKGGNPSHLKLADEKSSKTRRSNIRTEKCGAMLTINDAFCFRCSCSICHKYDDYQDPSLWLKCQSELARCKSGLSRSDYCGFSCHIECAFEKKKVGVVNLGQYMHLDGTYCCVNCGKVSGILVFWKKQLAIARDARYVDVLCHRIYMSYRLLEGTEKFKDLHKIIMEAKRKLEIEVGPINGDSLKMDRGIVCQLPIAVDVQKLCSDAIDKANQLLSTISSNGNVDSPPVTCRFLFEEVTSSSLLIMLIDIPSSISNSIIGYKLWYCKSTQSSFSEEPLSIFSSEKTRILVTNLEPCTEYTFRIVSYTETGDLGHSEAKCFTKSVETTSLKDRPESNLGGSSSGLKDRILEGVGNANMNRSCEVIRNDKSPKVCMSPPSNSLGRDLNVVSVDMDEDLTPHFDPSRDEDNGFIVDNGVKKNRLGLALSNEDSRAWAHMPMIDSLAENGRKRASSGNEEIIGCNRTLMNGSPFRALDGLGSLDSSFEHCVKVVRSLECEGHIKREFRLKFLTWCSLRSTEQERRVVSTFIKMLSDDPKSLACQLVDTFGEIVSNKRPRSSLTSVP